MIKAGEMICDVRNGRYIEPDARCIDLKVWSCYVYNFTEDGDLEIDGKYSFYEYELKNMKRLAGIY